jgi:photosystem II stability/assembly factor-like uncharacterized protein
MIGMRNLVILLSVAIACSCVHAQWQLQDSHTGADLRGIHALGNGIAWASGAHGVVLRTQDDGKDWQACATPSGASDLDFRGIQAFDASTAIVMSSGKGDLSRLYKTNDGCHTWKLVFTNPDPDGFWDAVQVLGSNGHGTIIGDPVDGRFALFQSWDRGDTWTKAKAGPALNLVALKDEHVFAASNSALIASENFIAFVTGGPSGSRIYSIDHYGSVTGVSLDSLPLAKNSPASGGFSVAVQEGRSVVVGGNYLQPDDTSGTAAYGHGGHYWPKPQTSPHGFRSAVAYDTTTKTWITVGPNGTDISTDDGSNWRSLLPNFAFHEPPDAGRNWNALSLPFAVGQNGRIGRLRRNAIEP